MEQALAELKERLGKLTDLRRTEAVLLWDMTVFMPPGGAPTRAAQLATLEGVIHECMVDERFGELFEALEPRAATLPHDSDEAALVRVAKRDWERARRVPTALAVEFAEVAAKSYEAWVGARAASDFAAFRPWLERVLELKRSYVECFAPYDDPYDVLLEDYDHGLRAAEVRRIFGVLEPALRSLVADHASDEEDAFMRGPFPIAAQQELSRELVGRFGASWDQFRLDTTVHPFEVTFGLGDIRLTTRYAEEDPNSLFTAMHECGHGLYEWGVSPSLERTPLCMGVSATLHESQSRLWENWVARSRPYLERLLPGLRERFPGAFDDIEAERLYRGANRVERSLIRIEADEVTYNLHILIRFELELEIFEGGLELTDLPEAWNARYRDYLGLEVPDDAHGVLQDVHWPSGAFGYFPTYSLGNIIAGQLWEAANRDLGDLPSQIGEGDLASLGGWLRENVHRHGRRLSPAQILERAGCGELTVEPLLGHLRGRVRLATQA